MTEKNPPSSDTPTEKSTPTAAEYAALGLSVPAAASADTTNAAPVPALQTESAVLGAPGPENAAAAPVTAPATASTPSGKRNLRKANTADPATPTPAPRAKKTPAKATTVTKTPAVSGPALDAVQAGVDRLGDQLVAFDSRLAAVEVGQDTASARGKAQQSLLTNQLADVREQAKELVKSCTASRVDIERIVNKLSRVESRIQELRAAYKDSPVCVPGLDVVESELAALRSQLGEFMDESAVLRERVDRLENIAATANETRDIVESIQRTLATLTHRQDAASAGPSRAHAPPSPPAPIAGSRRRFSDSWSDYDDRVHKAPRPEIPQGVTSYQFGVRPDRFAERPPPVGHVPPTYVSVRVGAGRHLQNINWGRREDGRAALGVFNTWTNTIDATGGIPSAIAAESPAGMADNFRLITFNSHADLMRFLEAWETRPKALENIIATPVPEIAAPPAPAASALGLLPPGPSGGHGNNGKGNKDANGRRPFY